MVGLEPQQTVCEQGVCSSTCSVWLTVKRLLGSSHWRRFINRGHRRRSTDCFWAGRGGRLHCFTQAKVGRRLSSGSRRSWYGLLLYTRLLIQIIRLGGYSFDTNDHICWLDETAFGV